MPPLPAELWEGSSKLINRLKSYYVKDIGKRNPRVDHVYMPG